MGHHIQELYPTHCWHWGTCLLYRKSVYFWLALSKQQNTVETVAQQLARRICHCCCSSHHNFLCEWPWVCWQGKVGSLCRSYGQQEPLPIQQQQRTQQQGRLFTFSVCVTSINWPLESGMVRTLEVPISSPDVCASLQLHPRACQGCWIAFGVPRIWSMRCACTGLCRSKALLSHFYNIRNWLLLI